MPRLNQNAPKDHGSMLTHQMDPRDPYETFETSDRLNHHGYDSHLKKHARSPSRSHSPSRVLPPIPSSQDNNAIHDWRQVPDDWVTEPDRSIISLEKDTLDSPKRIWISSAQKSNATSQYPSRSELIRLIANETNSVKESLQAPLSQLLARFHQNDVVQQRLIKQTADLSSDLEVLLSNHDTNLRDEAHILKQLSRQQTLLQGIVSSMNQQIVAMSHQMQLEREAARSAIQALLKSQQENVSTHDETRNKIQEDRVRMTGTQQELKFVREGLGELKGDLKDQMKMVVEALKEIEKAHGSLRLQVHEQKNGIETIAMQIQGMKSSSSRELGDLNSKWNRLNLELQDIRNLLHQQEKDSVQSHFEWKEHLQSLQTSWETRFHEFKNGMIQEQENLKKTVLSQGENVTKLVQENVPSLKACFESHFQVLEVSLQSSKTRHEQEMKAILGVIQTLKSSLHLRREQEKSQLEILQSRLDSFIHGTTNDIRELRSSLIQMIESGSHQSSKPSHPLIIM